MEKLEHKITISTLKRCLKLYDPKFVTFWNAKKWYKMFHNGLSLLILKLESQERKKMKSKDIEALTKRVNEAIERLEACALSSGDEEKVKRERTK